MRTNFSDIGAVLGEQAMLKTAGLFGPSRAEKEAEKLRKQKVLEEAEAKEKAKREAWDKSRQAAEEKAKVQVAQEKAEAERAASRGFKGLKDFVTKHKVGAGVAGAAALGALGYGAYRLGKGGGDKPQGHQQNYSYRPQPYQYGQGPTRGYEYGLQPSWVY